MIGHNLLPTPGRRGRSGHGCRGCMIQSEIDELLADENNEVPLDDNAANKNNEIPLDNTNPSVKNEQDTLNKNVVNKSDLYEED